MGTNSKWSVLCACWCPPLLAAGPAAERDSRRHDHDRYHSRDAVREEPRHSHRPRDPSREPYDRHPREAVSPPRRAEPERYHDPPAVADPLQ